MRLIDADALQREFDDAHKDEPDFYCCIFLNNAGNPSTEWDCVDEILEKAPTIDAQPVKHGYWKRNVSGELTCSYCGYEPQWDDDKFCANCGAKMCGGDA